MLQHWIQFYYLNLFTVRLHDTKLKHLYILYVFLLPFACFCRSPEIPLLKSIYVPPCVTLSYWTLQTFWKRFSKIGNKVFPKHSIAWACLTGGPASWMIGRVCVLQWLCGRLSLHLLIADSSTHFFTTDSFDGRSCVQDGQWYQQNLVEDVVHRFVVLVVIKSVCVLAKTCRYYSATDE